MNEEQRLVREMYAKIGVACPPTFDAWAFAISELGEVGSCLLTLGFGHDQDYVRGHPEKWTDAVSQLELEMGQALMMLIATANTATLDLDHCLQLAIDNLSTRLTSEPASEILVKLQARQERKEHPSGR